MRFSHKIKQVAIIINKSIKGVKWWIFMPNSNSKSDALSINQVI